jgi:NitT/TauT family transport system permease protein
MPETAVKTATRSRSQSQEFRARFRRRTKARGRSWKLLLAARLAVLIVIVVGWQLTSTLGHLEFYLSTPLRVWQQLRDWNSSGILWSALGVTLKETIIGFIIGGALGAGLGFLFGRVKFLGDVFEPFMLGAYALPKIALAPLFVLFFGIGIRNKVAMAALLVLFLVFYNTYSGTRAIDEGLCDQARLMGGSEFAVLRKIVIPQTAIWVFVGLKLALPFALIGAVVGEFIASTNGIGFLINNASSLLDTTGVYAGLIVLMIVALLLSAFLSVLERVFIPARPGTPDFTTS